MAACELQDCFLGLSDFYASDVRTVLGKNSLHDEARVTRAARLGRDSFYNKVRRLFDVPWATGRPF
jgi:hypothetical protein